MDNIYTLGTSKWRIWVTSRINDLHKEDSYSKEELDVIFESLRARDISVVVSFSNLPDASVSGGLFYWCSQSEGTKWLPGSLGGTFRNSGLYYCNSVDWEFISSPFQATQQEVDSGVNTDRFVTPHTLDTFSKWATKSNSDHTHTGIYQPLGIYSTDIHSNITALDLVLNTNTGDNATNSQYSGLALSKQDTLISGNNIKTVNGESILGPGDISISSGGSLVSDNCILNFSSESDTAIETILSELITNENIKGFLYIPVETTETSLDDFTINGVVFNIENIIDNISFDIRGSSLSNASGNYTIKYKIII